MRRLMLFFLAILFCFNFWAPPEVRASNDLSPAVSDSSVWAAGAGIGLDLSALWLLNPRAGAGQNQLNLGGVSTAFFRYQKERHSWQNFASFIFKIQRLGSGTLPGTVGRDIPFQKLVDELRFNSRYAYQSRENSNWHYAADVIFQSQVTASYGLENYVSDPEVLNEEHTLFSKFLSPAILTVAPGIEYRFGDPWFLLFSPSALRMIMVLDDKVAAIEGDAESERGIHGNPWRSETDFDAVDYQWGALLKGGVNVQLAQEGLSYRSELVLFSNFLNSPENLDMEWRNEFAYQLFKGFALTANFNMFYDHDIPVLLSDDNFPSGIQLDSEGQPVTGRRIFTLFQLNIQYNVIF
ncbi:MAG TPA: DUF3078 domain-containing protein [Saprospiraceae bacterium]|nr:DUF3078 domain-containing protein [Saprospiraceae bacterium]